MGLSEKNIYHGEEITIFVSKLRDLRVLLLYSVVYSYLLDSPF